MNDARMEEDSLEFLSLLGNEDEGKIAVRAGMQKKIRVKKKKKLKT